MKLKYWQPEIYLIIISIIYLIYAYFTIIYKWQDGWPQIFLIGMLMLPLLISPIAKRLNVITIWEQFKK